MTLFRVSAFPQWRGMVPAVLALCNITPARATTESDFVFSQFAPLEWVGGVNQEELDNGNGWLPGYEGQLATTVNLSEPHSAMGTLSGGILVADKNAHAIRLIGPDGLIRTVAGTNSAGFNGDGPAVSRQLNGPQHAYPMPDGSFYILDTGNQRIRRVDATGQMTTVIVESAGLSRGLWVKRDGSLIYYCTNTTLKRWTPALGQNPGLVMAQGFSELGNIDVAADGFVYLTDRGAAATDPTFSRVFRISPTATPSTWVPQIVAGVGGSTDSGPGSNGSPATSTGIRGVRGIAFHPAGGYFLATHKGGDVWYVDRNGIITMAVQGNDANVSAPSSLPVTLPSTGNSVLSELRSVSVALNGDLLIATNDSGYILRARYKAPPPTAPVLTVLPPQTAGGPFQLRWSQPEGTWFRIESTPEPGAGPWDVRMVGPATGGEETWNSPLSPSRQFFRLHQFRAWPN